MGPCRGATNHRAKGSRSPIRHRSRWTATRRIRQLQATRTAGLRPRRRSPPGGYFGSDLARRSPNGGDSESEGARPLRPEYAAAWDALRQIEDDAIPGLREQFLEALTALADGVDIDAVRQSLEAHDTEGVLRAVPLESFVAALEAALPTLDELARAAHSVSSTALGQGISYSEVSDEVIAAIRDDAA